jgi:hypothetical protein
VVIYVTQPQLSDSRDDSFNTDGDETTQTEA